VVVQGGNGRIIHNTYDNIQPRVGFAYLVTHNNVIRGSFGRFFDNWAAYEQTGQNAEGAWPLTGQLIAENLNQGLPNVTTENPFASGAALPAPTPFNQVNWFTNPLTQNPYSWQWNFGIQHSLGANTVVTANYVGASDHRLDVGLFANVAVTPGAGPIAPRQPYPYITPTYYDSSRGNGNYEALQVSLDRKTSKGLTYLISYTYSKTIDYGADGWYGADGTCIQNPYDINANKSVAGFSLTHMFSASWVYQLPFGKNQRFQTRSRALDAIIGPLQLNGILSLDSGQPYTLSAPSGIPNTGNVWERPNFTGQPISTPSLRAAGLWINPAAFAAPPPFTFGDVGRNALTSDWPRNLDLSLFREFPITESKRLEFRADFFNIGNFVVWDLPNGGGRNDPSNTTASVTDPNFGRETATWSTARQIQFALKLYF
jgi:hypothetical protein